MSTKNVISKNGVWKTAPLNDTPSSGGVLVVTDTGGTLDKTWQEIHDAMLVGYVVIDDGTNSLCAIGAVMDVRAGDYKVATCGLGGTALRAYTADSASGYPNL